MKYICPVLTKDYTGDLDAIREAIDDMAEQLGITETKRLELDQLGRDIHSMVAHIEAPADRFSFLAHGAYKECYRPFYQAPFIMKFCSNCNSTDREMEILTYAEEEDVAEFFIPTTFVRLNKSLPAPYLEDECESHSSRWTWDSRAETYVEREDYEFPELDFVEFQPRLTLVAEERYYELEIEPEYEKNPIIDQTGYNMPYDIIRRSGIWDRNWLEAAIWEYGHEKFEMLADFIHKYGIWDLHNRNLGYIIQDGREVPVIIDWLS